MERFAVARGYEKDGAGRFYHPDSSWIERINGLQCNVGTKSFKVATAYSRGVGV